MPIENSSFWQVFTYPCLWSLLVSDPLIYSNLSGQLIDLFLEKHLEMFVSYTHIHTMFVLYFYHTNAAHFALKKYHVQTQIVPPIAPFYTWKTGIPAFEFGGTCLYKRLLTVASLY